MTRSGYRFLAAVVLLCAFLSAALGLFGPSHTVHAAKLNRTTLELLDGSSMQLNLKGAKDTVTWKSKKASVARVNKKGLVTGVKAGSCTIVARCKGKNYKCKVTVRSLKNVNTKGALPGIDVSEWQGKINFRKVKEDGIHFVIIRAGHGTVADPTFSYNYTQAKKYGLKVGCYWFITSTSKKALKAQAKQCLEVIEGKTFDFPVFVDIESYSQFNKGKSFCSYLVDKFCKMVKEAGYAPGWYTSTSFVDPYLTEKVAHNSGYMEWAADHSKTMHYDRLCDIWQYSHTGRVSGISTYVDLNWYFPNAREEEE